MSADLFMLLAAATPAAQNGGQEETPMIYKGSCHCGAVAYEVEGEITALVECNCSICSRKGALLMAVPLEKLTIHDGEERLRGYRFNNHVIEHRFCATCGMHPFAVHETGGDAYVNVRCLEGVDLTGVEVIAFDGRSL
jgi:hypothetical protein